MPILEPHPFELETLTPIWTGGPQQSCGPRMFETGIIGSLRWWLEACARTRVAIPDPVADHLQYNPRAPLDLDPVSRIFGATGWRRRFRLTIESSEASKIPPELKVKSDPHPDPRNSQRTTDESIYYYRGARAFTGPFTIRIQPLAAWRADYDALSFELLRDLLALVAQHGMLGAKPQLGLGVVRLLTPSPVSGFPALRQWVHSLDYQKIKANSRFPSLSDMLFGEIDAPSRNGQEKDEPYWRRAFRIKPQIRRKFDDQGLRHRICGEKPARSKILISHPYLDERDAPRQRYCAWLPEGLGDEMNDSQNVRDTIKDFFDKRPGHHGKNGSTILL